MSPLKKILLSLPFFLSWVDVLTYFFVAVYMAFVDGFENAEAITHLVLAAELLVWIFLLHRVWNFKEVEKKEKWKWTFLFTFFFGIAMIIYIWFFDNEIAEERIKHLTNQE